jgi:hypothetical protein
MLKINNLTHISSFYPNLIAVIEICHSCVCDGLHPRVNLIVKIFIMRFRYLLSQNRNDNIKYPATCCNKIVR